MFARFLRVFHYLSLDIVSGAVVLLHFFSHMHKVKVDMHIYLVLAISIWLIYLVDHLRDAKIAVPPLRPHYHFILKHLKFVLFLIVILLLLGIYLIQFLDWRILKFGLIISFIVFFYAAFQHRLAQFQIKEFLIAIIYTTGILLPISISLDTFPWLSFTLLALLSFCNLLIFSWFECEEDTKDNFFSLPLKIGKFYTGRMIILLNIIGLSLAMISLWISSHYSFFILAFCLYLFIVFKPEKFKTNFIYRFLGDGIFICSIAFSF